MIENTDTKVVVLPEAKEKAYRMGYKRFDAIPEDERDECWFAHFSQSAEWANSIQPKLRAMAGARDRGHGTYTDHDIVVMVEYPDDRPMDGKQIHSRYVHSELVDMFRHGAYDAVNDRDSQPEQYF